MTTTAAVDAIAAVLLVVGVVGLYGALADGPASPVAGMFGGRIVPTLLAAVTAVGIWTFAGASPTHAWRLRAAAFGGGLALAVAAAELREAYPQGSLRNFRAGVETIHLKNFNLTEGLLLAQNVLRGRGITLPVAGGSTEIDTYRMPGYALFVAGAGALFRVAPDDVVRLAASAVYAQAWWFAGALALFAYELSGSLPLLPSVAVTAAVAWLPQSFDATQADAVVLFAGLLVLAALCRFHREPDPANVPLRAHVLVHAAFGLCFLLRSDVLLGWAGVSLFLYWKRRRYLALPLAFALALGSGWGLYKKTQGSDFVMTTSNLGHVAFVGLWQNPSNRFVWEPTDESYAAWIRAHGYRYTEPRADRFATREVVRFWATYPGYVAGDVWYKAYSSLRYQPWFGSLSLYPARAAGFVMRRFACFCFLAACVIALAVRFETRRVFLLGWPMLLNLPLFWLLQLNPKYLTLAYASLLVVAGLLFLDPDFYRRVGRPRAHVAVWSAALAIWALAPAIQRVLFLDGFRYWAPLLDPARSTLHVFR